MKGKSLYLVFVLFLLASLVLAACGGAEEPAAEQPAAEEPAAEAPAAVEAAKEIVIYNWTEYLDPEIYTLFEEEFGIKVVEDNFSNNEELLAKLQGGATGYALIVPSDYTVGIMVTENMLASLDHANIPNLANLTQRFTELPYDPGNTHCVPYLWGTTGLGYVDGEIEAPESWAVLFEPDPASPQYGRTTMLDDVREGFAAALAYLGYDINTTDEGQLQEAKALLIQAKAGLAGYDSDTYEDLLASGENLLAHGWNGDFLVAQEENENVSFVVPQEGGVVWVDNLCIPISATPEEKLAAEMFIDFLLRPDIGAMLANYAYYATPNQAAEAELDPEFLEDPTVYPPAEVIDKLQYIEPVGELESLYQRLWDEVKAAAQ